MKKWLRFWPLAAILLGVGIFLITARFQSVEDYYGAQPEEEAASSTVTLSIRCDDILAHYDRLDPALQSEEFVPADGVILPATAFGFTEGDTVFDLLLAATRQYRIQMEYQGSTRYGSAYVQGIGHLYEFSCGPTSGWMYRVNGVDPSVGCSNYALKPGDRVEWYYICSLEETYESNG